jgi:hypothetical protein
VATASAVLLHLAGHALLRSIINSCDYVDLASFSTDDEETATACLCIAEGIVRVDATASFTSMQESGAFMAVVGLAVRLKTSSGACYSWVWAFEYELT